MNTLNKYKHCFYKDKIIVMSCLSAVLALAGCQKEGTAEKTGKKIDLAAEKAENKLEQIQESVDNKIDASKQSLNQEASKASEYIDKSTEASKESLEKAGDKIDRAADSAEHKIEQTTEIASKEFKDAKAVVKESSETTGEYIDDSVITLKVKAAILNDPTFKGTQSQISVTTVNGVVTLSGTVDSEPSIGRAMELANSQKNVKSVVIDLEVDANSASKK